VVSHGTKKLSLALAISAAMAWGVVACVGDPPATADADAGSASDGSTSGDAASSDAGAGGDSSRDSAGPSCDAALPVLTTGVVQCVDDAGCSGGTPQCCYSNNANPNRCYTAPAACGSDSFKCDKASDCGGGTSICCLAGTIGEEVCPLVAPTAVGSVCRSTLDGGCGAAEVELCTASESCTGGRKCQALAATVSATGGPFERSLGACF